MNDRMFLRLHQQHRRQRPDQFGYPLLPIAAAVALLLALLTAVLV